MVAQVVAAQFDAPGWISDGLWLVVSPLWFLAVYLLLVVVAPMAHAAHRRAGPVAVVLLAGGSVHGAHRNSPSPRRSPRCWCSPRRV